MPFAIVIVRVCVPRGSIPVTAPRRGLMTRKVLIVDDSKLARMAVVKALNALHPD